MDQHQGVCAFQEQRDLSREFGRSLNFVAAEERNESLFEAALVPQRRLEIDPDRLVARLDGKPVILTPKEFCVASFLSQNRGRVVPAGELVAHLHGSEDAVTANAVEALIGRLRRKLGDDVIETRRGFGYLLSDG